MLKQVKKERKSKFLERLRSLFKREEKLIESLAFARLYGEHLQMSCDKGIYKVAFISPTQSMHGAVLSFRLTRICSDCFTKNMMRNGKIQ